MGLSRRIALSRSRDIRHVLDKGRRAGDGILKLSVLPGSSGLPGRVALVVPRFKHCIVERNLLRRRLQEIVRLNSELFRGQLLVLRLTPEAYALEYRELDDKFVRLLKKMENPPAPGGLTGSNIKTAPSIEDR